MLNPKIGEVYMVFLRADENEQGGWRPAVVTQNNLGNVFSPNLIVVPITSAKKKSLPTHVFLDAIECGLTKDSIALCEAPNTRSKKYFGRYITTLPYEYMVEIGVASFIATPTSAYITDSMLLRLAKSEREKNNIHAYAIA